MEALVGMPEVCPTGEGSGSVEAGNRSGARAVAHPSKRSHMCTECHRSFRTREELYVHAELCLLEAFENEAVSVFSDMPSLPKSVPPAAIPPPPNGITAKGDGPSVPPRLDAEIPNVHMPSTSTSSIARSTAECSSSAGPLPKLARYQRSTDSFRRPVAFPSLSEGSGEVGNARTIEGSGGLKLVVSVEKSEAFEDEFIDEGAEDDFDDVDEDVTVPGMPVTAPSLVANPSGKVIGALANADDDPFRPKIECPTCGLVLYRHNFSTHYRIHTGEMPFLCTYCNKRFRTTSALKVHIRAHTGEKPYSCPKCDYSCITKRNLDRHIINNHVREGERRGPRQRKSRYRNESDDEFLGLNELTDDIEADTLDHHYVVLNENDLDGSEGDAIIVQHLDDDEEDDEEEDDQEGEDNEEGAHQAVAQ